MNEEPSPARDQFEVFWRGLLEESSLKQEEIDASCQHFRDMPLRDLSKFCYEMARLLIQAGAEEKVERLARVEVKALRSQKRR